MRIGMIGLGKLGMPCAEVMAEKGHTVIGADLHYKESRFFKTTQSIYNAINNQDIIFIAVPTPHDSEYGGELPVSHLEPKPFDYSAIKNVLTILESRVKSHQLVCLISTVLPGTVRKQFLPYLKYPQQFLYNPYLIAMGSVKEDFLNPDMVILGGQNRQDTSLMLGEALYKGMVPNAPQMIGTWEEAESYKLFYNTFISMKISFVNMIQDVAQELGHMNVDNVTNALARSQKRITSKAYMKAGMGDGGACHPRDNIALRYLAQELNLGYDLFDAIVRSREKQAERLARFVRAQGNLDVVIVGKSYKPNISLIDGSYSLLVGHYLSELGAYVHYHDEDVGNFYYGKEKVTVLVGHWSKYTEKFLRSIHRDSVIVDPWRKMSTTLGKPTVIHYGNRE